MGPDGSALKDLLESLPFSEVFGVKYGFHLCCCCKKEQAFALSSHREAVFTTDPDGVSSPTQCRRGHSYYISLASVQGPSLLLFLHFLVETSQKY